MKKMLSILILAGLACLSYAGDLTIKNGNVYKDYVIMGAAPNGIRVFYNNGTGDREVILPVEQFPDELKDKVNRLARKIPEEKRKAQAEANQARAAKARNAQLRRAEKARLNKAATILKKEQSQEQKIQADLIKRTPKQAKNPFKVN